MTDELKLCPFCGQPARFLESILNRGGVSCSNHECISWIRTTPEIWNARPVEDALRAENERLREVERKAIEQSEYIQTHGLTEYELALKDAEIKQLRAENERLREALANRDSILRRLISVHRSAAGYDLLDEEITPLVEEFVRLLGR